MDSQIKIWDLKVGYAALIWGPEGEGTNELWCQALGCLGLGEESLSLFVWREWDQGTVRV